MVPNEIDTTRKSIQRRNFFAFGILVVFLFVLSWLDLFLGSVKIPFIDIFKILLNSEVARPEWGNIIFDFRIPKLITAILAGAALSISGLQMQTIFRNPLAGPYVLGISAGASLGVAILVMGFSTFFTFNYFNIGGNWLIALVAWIGAGAVLALIFAVSLRVSDIMTILILGILVGSAVTAIVSILQYFSNESLLKTFIVWTMGSLGGVTQSQLHVLLPAILLGLIISLFSGKILNVLLLGENYAKSLGLNIKLARLTIFFSTSILAGSITAFCGPIGFIGIAVPHLARIAFNTANHHILVPASMILGAVVMVTSDIISQLPGSQSSLPINSVTALIGIPVVVYLIVKNQKLSSIL
jgi:iron complex transport system permease protein